MDREKTIPYFAHEGIVARMERMNRRLLILSAIETVIIIVLKGRR